MGEIKNLFDLTMSKNKTDWKLYFQLKESQEIDGEKVFEHFVEWFDKGEMECCYKALLTTTNLPFLSELIYGNYDEIIYVNNKEPLLPNLCFFEFSIYIDTKISFETFWLDIETMEKQKHNFFSHLYTLYDFLLKLYDTMFNFFTMSYEQAKRELL